MEAKEYRLMYSTEECHWYFKGKRKIIFPQMEELLGNSKNLKILDIGCGTGIIMREMQKYGTVFGIDIEMLALQLCKKRGLLNLSKSSAVNAPFKDASFDIVTIFDILYHKAIKNDKDVLAEAFRILKQNGTLVITDTADIGVKSRHDLATHTRERYTAKKMINRLEASGLKVTKITHYNSILLPFIYIMRRVDNAINKGKPPASDIKKTNKMLNSILYFPFIIESFIIKFFDIPFGVSIFCIAKKPSIAYRK